jgi:hypothetical protein
VVSSSAAFLRLPDTISRALDCSLGATFFVR